MTNLEQQPQAVQRGFHHSTKRDLIETAHPAWVTAMLDRLAVLDSPVFAATAVDGVADATWRRVVREFFSVVEAFPKYRRRPGYGTR